MLDIWIFASCELYLFKLINSDCTRSLIKSLVPRGCCCLHNTKPVLISSRVVYTRTTHPQRSLHVRVIPSYYSCYKYIQRQWFDRQTNIITNVWHCITTLDYNDSYSRIEGITIFLFTEEYKYYLIINYNISKRSII